VGEHDAPVRTQNQILTVRQKGLRADGKIAIKSAPKPSIKKPSELSPRGSVQAATDLLAARWTGPRAPVISNYLAVVSDAAGVAAFATLVGFLVLWATFFALGASLEVVAAGVAVALAGVLAAVGAAAGVAALGTAAKAAEAKSEAMTADTSLFMVSRSPVGRACVK
jgi:hypothetical protein